MKKRTSLLFLLALFAAICSAHVGEEKSKGKNLDEQAADLLARMTLEEKIGQMTQVAIDVVATNNRAPGAWQNIDRDKLRTAILKYNVGSIFNVQGSAYSLDNWHEIITQIQDFATRETRLHIPVL